MCQVLAHVEWDMCQVYAAAHCGLCHLLVDWARLEVDA